MTEIKVGQKYKIIEPCDCGLDSAYQAGDIFEVVRVYGNIGYDKDNWCVTGRDIVEGCVELCKTSPNVAEPNLEDISDNTPERDNKYLRTITNRHTGESIQADVYDVLKAYDITCPCMAHGIKKALVPGGRHSKSVYKDKKEAAWSIEESIILNGDKETGEEV